MLITYSYGVHSAVPSGRYVGKRLRRLLSVQQKADIISEFRSLGDALGVTGRQIAARLGVLEATYAQWRKSLPAPDLMLERLHSLTSDDFPEGRIDQRGRPSLPFQQNARAQDMAKRLAAGETLQAIGDDYGISRERVRQICAKYGYRSTVLERAADKAAKRALAIAAKAAAKLAKSTDRDERLARAKFMVEQNGVSIRKAMAAEGFTRSSDRLAVGWNTSHGRWRPELEELRAKIVAGLLAGETWASIQNRLGVSSMMITTAQEKAGIQRTNARARISLTEQQAIVAAYEGGATISQICTDFSRCWQTVKSTLTRSGIVSVPRVKVVRVPSLPKIRQPISIDAFHAQGIWTEPVLALLVDGWNAGKTATEIAKALGPTFTRNAVLGKVFRLRKSLARKPEAA